MRLYQLSMASDFIHILCYGIHILSVLHDNKGMEMKKRVAFYTSFHYNKGMNLQEAKEMLKPALLKKIEISVNSEVRYEKSM